MLLRPRGKPPILPDDMPEGTPERDEATVLVTDMYQGLDGVRPGTVKYIRVLE